MSQKTVAVNMRDEKYDVYIGHVGRWGDKMYKKLVIGIDQSYTKTGISIAADGKLLKVASIGFKGARIKSEKRKMLANTLTKVLEKNAHKAKECVVICERIRHFSHGDDGKAKDAGGFMNMAYIKATGALIAVIVDTAFEFGGVAVYSADTRSWKSQVVGTPKAIKGDKKLATVRYVKSLGFKKDICSVNKKGEVVYDDDAADSACIALYGFCKGRKLKLEL